MYSLDYIMKVDDFFNSLGDFHKENRFSNPEGMYYFNTYISKGKLGNVLLNVGNAKNSMSADELYISQLKGNSRLVEIEVFNPYGSDCSGKYGLGKSAYQERILPFSYEIGADGIFCVTQKNCMKKFLLKNDFFSLSSEEDMLEGITERFIQSL
ncbi:MAG: hypothetical protein ACQESF_02360 [Nanobdellota archaeon]